MANNPNYSIIIPARFTSTRFPGKPLAMLGDKPVLQHVYERACQSQAQRVIIATDDHRIEAAAIAIGAEVCMTSADHVSGSERLAEVVARQQIADSEILVNVQGDEPFIPTACIDQVAGLLAADSSCGMSTLCHAIESREEIDNPNVVKVVRDANGNALYFSRAAIPWDREGNALIESDPIKNQYFRHIGLYAYTAGFLRRYTEMPPCQLEQIEALEQLRVLWHGEKIRVAVTELDTGIGIDTPEDLQRANAVLACQSPGKELSG